MIDECHTTPFLIPEEATSRFTHLKNQSKTIICNPYQLPSPSLAILVSLWFIIISLMFLYLINYCFHVSFILKVILYTAKIKQNIVTEFL